MRLGDALMTTGGDGWFQQRMLKNSFYRRDLPGSLRGASQPASEYSSSFLGKGEEAGEWAVQ